MSFPLDPPYNIDNEDPPEVDGVTCNGCDHFVADDAVNDEAFAFGGYWWCSDCYYALPQVSEALNQVASRGDYE